MTATTRASRPRASQVGNLLATQTTLATALKIVDLAAKAVARLTAAAPRTEPHLGDPRRCTRACHRRPAQALARSRRRSPHPTPRRQSRTTRTAPARPHQPAHRSGSASGPASPLAPARYRG